MHRQIPAEREQLITFLSHVTYWRNQPTPSTTFFQAPLLIPGTIAVMLKIAKSENCSLDKLKEIATNASFNTREASSKISDFCAAVLQATSYADLNNYIASTGDRCSMSF